MIFNPKPMCGHTSTHIANAKAATCGANGYTGDTVCDNCGEILSKGSVISATGNHQYTSSQSGSTITYTCKVCGHKYTQQVPTVTITVTGSINNTYGMVSANCDGKSLRPGQTVQVTRGSMLSCAARNTDGTSKIQSSTTTVASAGAGQVARYYFTVNSNSNLIMIVQRGNSTIQFNVIY